jgi:hypothetical protein
MNGNLTCSNTFSNLGNVYFASNLVVNSNLGIGKTNPSYTLDVNGTIRSSGSIRADSDGSYIGVGYVNPTLGFIKRSGEEQAIACCQPTNGYNAFIRFGQLQTSNFDSNFTGVAFNEWGRFNSNGNFGIGTSFPDYRLDVNGTTRTSTLMFTSLYAGSGNASYWNYGTNGDWYIRSVGNSGNVILQDILGNVGIGNASPSYKLDVSGTTRISSGNANYPLRITQTNTAGQNGYSHAILALNSGLSTGEAYLIQFGQADNTRNNGYMGFVYQGSGSASNYVTFGLHSVDRIMNITGSGYVGIGTTTPTSSLHVVGSSSFSGSGQTVFFNNTSTGLSPGNFNHGTNWSIRTNDHIGAAGFVAISDKRIKTNITPITADFTTFQDIEPVEYTYIDPLKRKGKQYGFIAQDIQKLLPDVIDQSEDVVPDIFKKSQLTNNTFVIPPNTNISIGDKLRIIIKDECQKDVEIVGVADNIATMDYNHEKTAEIFIYGKHVDDFLNINHDHLLAYTVAHTQELYKKLSSALDRISYLEEEVSKMRAV